MKEIVEAKFTKGPWFVGPFEGSGMKNRIEINPTIATVYGAQSEAEANAHLIAAATELYEALDELLTKAKALVEWVNKQEIIGVSNYDNAFNKAEFALAKAEGRAA